MQEKDVGEPVAITLIGRVLDVSMRGEVSKQSMMLWLMRRNSFQKPIEISI